MAATVQLEPVSPSRRIVNVRGDASYATGGYAVSASLFGSTAPGGGAYAIGLNDLGAVIAEYDATNKKVKFITRATGAEVLNASDQSAVTVKLLLMP